ncbi:MAG: protein-glutamate O-methyltransferase CheR [Gemmatimonadota bacterium]
MKSSSRSETIGIRKLPELTREQFDAIRGLVHQVAGITIADGKEKMVQTRLARRVRTLGLSDFDAYLEHLERDTTGRELSELVDALTTNKTAFFREPQHFAFLREAVLPELAARGRPMSFWSAGCSSGEEAYTLAMVARDAVPSCDALGVRILATDISARMLRIAREAVYPESAVADVPEPYRSRYFRRVPGQATPMYRVGDEVRRMVRIARLNLLDHWPMRGPFDVIFCRNVMIYFDHATQERLVRRFHSLLAPGGYLCVGHSESLGSLSHAFRFVRPAIYRK